MTPAPTARPAAALARLVAALALLWCAAFPLVGLAFRLQTFADAGLFAYAVAAGESWSFHWRNISGRAFAWAWASAPAEAWGRLTGDPEAAVALYGALWFAAPAVGLAATLAADRSAGRAFTLWACAATALVLPLLFGFPTELWVAHAAFWPALALLHAPGGGWRSAATLAALLALVLSHEGGVVWGAVAVGTLALRPAPLPGLLRGAGLLALALAPWAALKRAIRPEPYVAEVLERNAANFLDLTSLLAPVVLLCAAALALYAAVFLWGLRRGAVRPAGTALAATAAALALWWLALDGALHGWDRYYLRTLLLGVTPAAAIAAALHATGAAGRFAASRPRLAQAGPALAQAAMGAALALSLIHAVETAKFVRAWSAYVAQVRALAMGQASDPALGDPAFVSAARIATDHDRLGWHSTTPFLSALSAPGMAPRRLVVDPAAAYFWFPCAAAEASRDRPGPAPQATRDLVARYACGRR
jgi:hypothetical protein